MMSKKQKKLLIIIIAVLVTVMSVTGATIAYIYTETPPVENSFEPVYVSCKVEEQFDGTVKSNVAVRNTGNIDAYVRATFVIMWVADDGSVYGKAPVLGTDYSIVYGSPKWTLGSDGFYYYANPVSGGDVTDVLVEAIRIKGTAPEGYSLVVHVTATAIQSTPANAVADVWGVEILDNGGLIAPK